MPTIAIVGAGPRLGAAVARRFAREGFDTALLCRRPETLASVVQQVTAQGVRAEAWHADVSDEESLRTAVSKVEERLGEIDVLLYSPAPSASELRARPLVDAPDLTPDNVQRALELCFFGALRAVNTVLPGMMARGRGTLLATSGLTDAAPYPAGSDLHSAYAALRQWLVYLDATTRDRGVRAAHVGIAAYIGQGGPRSEPSAIADALWDVHANPSSPSVEYVDLPDDWSAEQGLADKFR